MKEYLKAAQIVVYLGGFLYIYNTTVTKAISRIETVLSRVFHLCYLKRSEVNSYVDTKLIVVGESLHDDFFASQILESETPLVKEESHVINEQL